MVWKHQFRAPVLVLLIAVFLSQGCADTVSTTESPIAVTVTPFIATTSTPFAVPAMTLSPELLSAAQTIVTAIETNQPGMLRALIGDEGVAPGGFAQGVDLKGYNNADEIVAAFDDALNQSNPVCEGYVTYMGALPDKAILVYRGVKLDWSQFGFSDNGPDHAITLQLFNMPEGWRLVYITPLDLEWGLAHLGPLQDCPA